jgi:hypothetical protein
MKRIKILTLVLIALSLSAYGLVRSGWMQSRSDGAKAGADVIINFDAQQLTERVWSGPATGGVTGNVTIEALNNAPPIFRGTWSGVTRWQVVAGGNSFVAEMEGKINTFNGVMVMRGKVLDGANPGASVWAQGQVTSINPHHFVGTIRVIQP